MTLLTHDSISLRGAGVVSVAQQRKGVRFTLDSLLLADFCRIRPRDRVLEPGAGTGIISLLLAKKFPRARFVADEVEPHAYGLLERNIEANGLVGRIVSVDRDIKELGRLIVPETFDAIVANPPYGELGTGKKCPSTVRQAARQNRPASLLHWFDLQTLLKNKGRYFVVFPSRRAAELMSFLLGKNLEPKRLRFVHPHPDKPASLVLMEAVKGAGPGIEILPPLFVHEQDGGYTNEMQKIYGI